MLPVFASVVEPIGLLDLGMLGLFVNNSAGEVYEISAGGDFTAAMPFAFGFATGGNTSLFAFVRGCGDALLESPEECDDGNQTPGDGCGAVCQVETGCGNGILDPAEQCDDDNLVDGDGCSATCTFESCTPAPRVGCTVASKAKVTVKENKPGKEKLSVSLKKLADATTQADFGDPVAGTTVFGVCLYDEADSLVAELRVDRAGELCGAKPCWKAKSTKGYSYKDKEVASDGVKKIQAKSGPAGKGKVAVAGKNNAGKGQTDLPTGVAAALQGTPRPPSRSRPATARASRRPPAR